MCGEEKFNNFAKIPLILPWLNGGEVPKLHFCSLEQTGICTIYTAEPEVEFSPLKFAISLACQDDS